MKKPAARTKGIRIGIRISLADHLEIERLTKTREFSSSSALVRAAIRNEIHGREGMIGMEERIVSSFERLSHENLRLSRALQALFALVDALTKTFLTCIPEPTAEVKGQAVVIARERYHRLIKSAGSGMSGDARAAMDGILSNDSER